MIVENINELHKEYNLVYADPPWKQSKGGKKKVRANSSGKELDYPTCSLEEIKKHLELATSSAGGREKSERWLATTRSGMRSELTTQTCSTQNNQFSDSQYQEELGATAISNLQPYGFPISIGRGNWCTGLKTKALKQLERKQCVFGKVRLHNGRKNKYCAIPRNSSR